MSGQILNYLKLSTDTPTFIRHNYFRTLFPLFRVGIKITVLYLNPEITRCKSYETTAGNCEELTSSHSTFDSF